MNSPGQEEDNSWQAFVFVPKDNWYIAKVSFLPSSFLKWHKLVLSTLSTIEKGRIIHDKNENNFQPKENMTFPANLSSCIWLQIPLSRYMPTWRGNLINAKLEMNPSRVLGMSLSVNAEGGVPGAKSGPGDFHVEIDWIKALRTE